jgi:thymidine kinase
VAGRIEVICGCMFSGKTARLIDRLAAAAGRGLPTAAFKHVLDVRYDSCHLATHDGRRCEAVAVGDAGEIVQRSAGADVIGIDEAQFFGAALITMCTTLRDLGRHVIVAGIDHDAWGHPFTPLPELKELADAVEVLHVPCRVCGRPARYSQRMVPVRDGNMVGGPAEYEPRCAACFQPLRDAER